MRSYPEGSPLYDKMEVSSRPEDLKYDARNGGDDLSLVSILRAENERVKREVLKFDSLQETNLRLNRELDEARAAAKKRSSELRKGTASLTSQLEAAQQEKNELSRRFWNLTEDCKEISNDLERLTRERNEAVEKHDKVLLKNKQEKTDAARKEESILRELDRAQSRLDDQAREAADQKEIGKQRIDGMKEAIDVMRGELVAAEDKRDSLKADVRCLHEHLETEQNMCKMLHAEKEHLQKTIKELDSTYSKQRDAIAKFEEAADRLASDLGNALASKEEHEKKLASAVGTLEATKGHHEQEMESCRRAMDFSKKQNGTLTTEIKELQTAGSAKGV